MKTRKPTRKEHFQAFVAIATENTDVWFADEEIVCLMREKYNQRYFNITTLNAALKLNDISSGRCNYNIIEGFVIASNTKKTHYP